MNKRAWGRRIALVAAVAIAFALVARADVLVAAWKDILELITVSGDPVSASPAVLSEHDVQELETAEPQAQAERLLERAINHYDGATELIAERVDGWRQKLRMEGTLNGLFLTAMNANDLRVRAAGIEMYLAANDVGKAPSDLDEIMSRCDGEADGRPYRLWIVGLLGNRGVDPRRALDFLLRWSNDPDETTRQWAVEGIAMLGTDDSIAPLLSAFHDDPSPVIRERAACALAQHGMLTARQRFSAIPELLRYADDPALDDQTRVWVFQALKDISGERLKNDVRDWRDWWSTRAQLPAQIAR